MFPSLSFPIIEQVFELTKPAAYYCVRVFNNVFPLIYCIQYLPDQVFSLFSCCQFVYHIVYFSTVEFGIQFLLSCILSSCHCFLSNRFVLSVVNQVLCCSTALPLLETIFLFLHCFLHFIIPPLALHFCIFANR